MDIVLAVMAVRIIGDPSPPVDVLAMLDRGQTDTVISCKKIARSLNAQDVYIKAKYSFECTSKTFNIDPSRLALKGIPQVANPEDAPPLLFPPSEQILMVSTFYDAFPRPAVITVENIFRIGKKMPLEFAMNVCRADITVIHNNIHGTDPTGMPSHVDTKCVLKTVP
jgi:hypothetical protein